MLPFLKPKSAGGLIITHRESDNPDQSQDDSGLEACADELIRAIQSGDKKSVAIALKDIFMILESQPNEEPSDPIGE